MQHKVAPIGVRPSTLSGLSERMIVSHYEDCYGNAVRALNVVRREAMPRCPARAADSRTAKSRRPK